MEITNKREVWLKEIRESLNELGGQGTLVDIYSKIEDRNRINLALFSDWKAQVRKNIYLHSSDCEIFTGVAGDNKDVFYSLEGKGKGLWGIREFSPFDNNVELTEDDIGFVEGKKKLRQHIHRERNPKVIRLAKEKFKRENGGRLFCEVCNFDFFQKYGELGDGFIEGHHIIPVSELGEGQETNIQDIVMVCSNCHRMLHRKRPWLMKEQLKQLLKT